MEQAVKAFAPDRAEAPRWIGRIVMAVLLGEAIWGLIVSVMSNLIVPGWVMSWANSREFHPRHPAAL